MRNLSKALIFAAGRGERMRPLTDNTPKPLLMLGGKPLIIWQIEALARAGFGDIVINTAWLGDKIEAALGDGARWNVTIRYSREGSQAEDALETRGAIVKALDVLGPLPFITTSSDVFTDYDYAKLHAPLAAISRGEADAHFVLADNPLFHKEGDFAIRDGFASRVATANCPRLNYASMSCWHPQLFANLPVIRERLFPWADAFVSTQRVTAEYFSGCWENIGTVEHLSRLQLQHGAKIAASISSGLI